MKTGPGRCELCGEMLPRGEEIFNYHGYSGPCPKPPKEPTKPDVSIWDELAATSLHPLVPRIVARGRALERVFEAAKKQGSLKKCELELKKALQDEALK